MDGEIPLAFKLAYTALLLVIGPVYAKWWGWRNFLWFSDIALFGTGLALWMESALLASTMALAVLLVELVWCASYFGRLLLGVRITDLAAYMFDPAKPRFVRALSLFHVVLPAVQLWLLHELGYDSRALAAQTVLAWVVLPITYAVLRPDDENINWVRGPGGQRAPVPPLAWLAVMMAALPLGLYLPTHLVLQALF